MPRLPPSVRKRIPKSLRLFAFQANFQIRSSQQALLYRLRHRKLRIAAKTEKQGVNVVGYLRSEFGLGEAARLSIKALHTIDYPVAYTNLHRHGLLPRKDTTIQSMAVPPGSPYSINLLHINPEQLRSTKEVMGEGFFRNRYTIGYWFWELSVFPEIWHDQFNSVDEVWVASRFCQASIAAHSPVPVNVLPPAVQAHAPAYINRDYLGLPKDRFLFLYVFDALSYLERKNPLGVIRAFNKAFKGKTDKVQLVLKTNELNTSPLANEVRAAAEEANCILMDCTLSHEEIYGMMNVCDAYVSLHRSEGFGLTIAEAMSLGKPAIATAYSATLEFMTPENSYLVDYTLVSNERTAGPYQKGQLWAEPDEDQAAYFMNKIVEAPDPGIASRAAADICRQFHPQLVGRNMKARLDWIYANCL